MTSRSGVVRALYTIKIKEGKRDRMEEIWRLAVDYVDKNWSGKVKIQLFYDEAERDFLSLEEFVSQEVRDTLATDPIRMGLQQKAVEEDLMDGPFHVRLLTEVAATVA